MKLLTTAALLCAMMALTTAGALQTKKASKGTKRLQLTEESSGDYVEKPNTTCSCGWKRFSKRCFLYVFHAMSWAQAQRNCDHIDANLASIHTFKEYKFIQHLIISTSHSSKQTWLGGSDAQESGYWFWIDGTQFRYANWCSGRPDNYYTRERCLQMNFSDHKCWDDTYCSTLLPSICVKKIS